MNTLHCHFLDDFEILEGVRAVAGPCDKLGAKILADSPGDLETVSVFAGTVIANSSAGFNWYYTGRHLGLRTPGPRKYRIMLAQSENGVDWRKPELDQVLVDGIGTCQLAIQGLPEDTNPCQPIVHRLDDGSWRMYFWLHGTVEKKRYARYITAESEDGIRWHCPDINRVCVYHPADSAMPRFDWVKGLVMDTGVEASAGTEMDVVQAKGRRSNDATFVVRNPFDGLWEMYSVWLLPTPLDGSRRCGHDNAPGVLRTLHRRTSEDGLCWSDPEIILVPDRHDPMDQQFYHLAVHWLGRERIGLLGNYRLDEQTMDIELCFSRDGLHWDRPVRGGAIPRGAAEAADCMSIYPVQGVIMRGGEWLVPYSGGNVKHNAFRDVRNLRDYRDAGYIARFHADRLTGLATRENVPGHVVTKPFMIKRGPLALDATIEGQVRFSLCDAFGMPLPGYTSNDCVPVSGDSHQHLLRWQNGKDAAEHAYDVAVLRLELQRASLYAVHF